MREINRMSIIRFLIYFNFFFPTFNSIFYEASFGVGNSIIHFLTTLFCIIAIFIKDIPNIKIIIIAFTYFACFFILICISIILSPNEVSFRDLFEFHRPFYYGSVFILALVIKWDSYSLYKYIIRPIIICFTLQIIIGLIFSMDFNTIKEIQGLYTKSKNIRTGRITGTFTNPYDYGVMIVFAMIYFLINFFTLRKHRILNLIMGTCSILVIMISQSRTAAIVMFLAIVYLIIFFIISKTSLKLKIKILIYITLIILFIIVFKEPVLSYIHQNFSYLYSGIEKLISNGIQENGSSRARIEQLKWAFSEISKGYFFGFGPSKTVREFLEMQYSLYLYRYGIPGLLLVISYFIYSIFISYKLVIMSKKSDFNYETISFFTTFHIWCMVLPIASFGNPFIDMTRISFFFFGVLGVCTSIYYRNKFETKII